MSITERFNQDQLPKFCNFLNEFDVENFYSFYKDTVLGQLYYNDICIDVQLDPYEKDSFLFTVFAPCESSEYSDLPDGLNYNEECSFSFPYDRSLNPSLLMDLIKKNYGDTVHLNNNTGVWERIDAFRELEDYVISKNKDLELTYDDGYFGLKNKSELVFAGMAIDELDEIRMYADRYKTEQIKELEDDDPKREMAVHYDDKYIMMHETDDGYDYTLYDKNFQDIDGGQIDLDERDNLSIRQAMKMVIEDLKESFPINDSRDIKEVPYNEIEERIDKNNERIDSVDTLFDAQQIVNNVILSLNSLNHPLEYSVNMVFNDNAKYAIITLNHAIELALDFNERALICHKHIVDELLNKGMDVILNSFHWEAPRDDRWSVFSAGKECNNNAHEHDLKEQDEKYDMEEQEEDSFER